MRKAIFARTGIDEVRLLLTLNPPWSWDRVEPETREKMLKSYKPNRGTAR